MTARADTDRLDPPPPGHKPVIGLVGGVGSGKSHVARLLGELGCAVIDADRLARDALNLPAALEQIRSWWGTDTIANDGTADRAAIGRIVFDQPDQLARLERLIHPQVHAHRQKLHQLFQQNPDTLAIVEDCPLLIEAGLDEACDAIIFVSAPKATRLARVRTERGWSQDDLEKREKNQIGLDKKADMADYVVENGAADTLCLPQIRRVLSQILLNQQ